MAKIKTPDRFHEWLLEMDQAMERLKQSVPAELAARLDHSPASLDALEAFVLATYPTVEAITADEAGPMLDGMTRYVGQIFRAHCGGVWLIGYKNKRMLFHGMPQLVGMRGQTVPMSPRSVITASVDRRTGTFISGVFQRNLQVARAG